ncbi:MAG TPA: hypothetical protein VGK56_04140 [Anaerolineales bacterium]
MKKQNKRNLFLKWARLFLISLPAVCLLLVGGLAVSNLGMPRRSSAIERLSGADKARLAEFQHLRTTLGDSVWPGWGQADIPVILYNEEYAFLVEYPEPADGWVKIPTGIQRGGPWEVVPSDAFLGTVYYRQNLPDPEITPEAFTVVVGDRWVASLTTLEWFEIKMQQNIRNDLPELLRPIFPYRLFLRQLVDGIDQYISLIAHESFHALQGVHAPEKLAASESANIKLENQYPWADTDFQHDWQAELDLLTEALRSTNGAEVTDLVRQFLALRAERRERAGLSSDLIAYEKQREWLEGLARYGELELWRQASRGNYQPVPEVVNLPNFKSYAGYQIRWERELDQIAMTADDTGDGRFYYSGMAQAFLLDQLFPNWKTRAFQEDVWLDDLLAEVVKRYE